MLMLVNTIVSLSLLALLSQFGMLAAAAASPIKILLMLPVSLWLSRKVIGYSLSDYFSALKSAAVVTGLIALAWLFVHYLFTISFKQLPAVTVAISKAIIIGGVLLGTLRLIYWQEIVQLRQDLRYQLS